VDTALQEREAVGRPIQVGMVGAGATGRVVIQEIPASQFPLGENAQS
jgi:predicted homoserine dehydrogenase-like protein